MSKELKCLKRIDTKNYLTEREHKEFLGVVEQALLKAQEQKKVLNEALKLNGEWAEELDYYKELEEQLGCPLDVVITPYFKRGKLEVFYRGKMREVIRVVAFEEATRPYIDVFYRDNEKEQFKVRTIWLDDYKKTWWLKENREE